MPQNNLGANVAQNPSKAAVPLQVDNDGALIISNPGVAETISIVQTLGTVAATGVFQNAMAANPLRAPGGAIVNHGTADMSVSFQAVGTAKTTNAIPLAAKTGVLPLSQITADNAYGGVVTITGTIGDTFTTIELSRD